MRSGRASTPAQVEPAPAPHPAGKPAACIRLEDIRAVKELVGRVGVDNLKTLVALLAQ